MTFKPTLPKKKQVSPKSFRLSDELINDLEVMAEAHGIKVNRLVSQALEYIVNEWKQDKGKIRIRKKK